ncbi:hypothetical protein P153DRAFT_432919 [Dothidotthia symphoricarpi CBS 119687]|uniref:BTB domain-containing protein n=1 Tax=Dothidotthia symphoricarpi CBS 119687 TaxID=1392245 RepID=A0A6A6A8C8_9PLEO|nr:uncharacterized protein P153DRAFT_432919 [Dothidotthia symphoricarpi CBS 119687]KAF2127077.1 hypothetical protein P153DRAFT_432919 [Dothidotthia symphoricarpi CBS 119687]
MADGKYVEAQRPSAATRDEIVTIEIGPEHTKHLIHKALLIEHSEYFKKALNGPWKEAQNGAISLEDVDSGTFDIFVDWLYSQKLPATNRDWAFGVDESDNTIVAHARQLARIKAYTFGDRFLCLEFAKAVRNSLVDHLVTQSPYYDVVIHAFTNLPPENPILRLLVDCHCHVFEEYMDLDESEQLQKRDQLPHAFLIRVMLKYSRILAGAYEELDRCDYHEHGSEEEKQECKKSRRE